MRRALFVLVALCACGKNGKDVDPCGAAGEQFAKVRHAEKPGDSESKITRVKNAIAAECRSSMWDDAAITCVRGIKTLAEATACWDKLDAEDREDLDARLAQLDPPPADGCKRVVDKEVELVKAQTMDVVGEERIAALKLMGEVVDAMEKSCRGTSWSKQAIECMAAREVIEDTKDCVQYFTPDQLASLPKAYGGSAPGPAEKEGDCEGAVDHMASLQRDSLMATPQKDRAHFEERITKMREAMLHACRETKWSEAITTCIKNMKSLDEAEACEKMGGSAQ